MAKIVYASVEMMDFEIIFISSIVNECWSLLVKVFFYFYFLMEIKRTVYNHVKCVYLYGL